MPKVAVDTSTLLQIRSELVPLHAKLIAIESSPDGFDGVLGGRALERDLEAFCAGSGRGLSGLADELAALQHKLAAAITAYEAAEGNTKHAASGPTTTTGMPPTTHSTPGKPWQRPSELEPNAGQNGPGQVIVVGDDPRPPAAGLPGR